MQNFEVFRLNMYFIKHKPLISEECTYFERVLRLKSSTQIKLIKMAKLCVVLICKYILKEKNSIFFQDSSTMPMVDILLEVLGFLNDVMPISTEI